ncbi:MAG: divergent PAP2 family protein [Treponema sp.]|jgi:acid phosphatase family membrane protein YuiD|nr:divergent PAP2 family protein [Treponema sp.]
MEYLKSFVRNPVFLAAVTSWFLAQLIKTIVALLRSRKQSFKDTLETLLWRSGGMPSSHSALASSLAMSIGFSEGFDSNLFLITMFLAFVIMRDSLGVRRSSGVQGRVLNTLGRSVSEKLKIDFHPVKEVYGHEPLEVVIGALLGMLISAAFFYL